MNQLAINTAQNVQINFDAATIGDRVAAYFIDLVIKIAYGIVVYGIFFYGLGISSFIESTDQWSRIAIVIVFGIPIILYTLVLELLFEGQTIGKKALKIKVVKIDGYQASFGEYLIRWFFRVIDIDLFSGMIALVTIATSKKSQRLGDIVSGTSVITLQNKIKISHTILEDFGETYVPVYSMVVKLSDNDMRIIKETFLRAKTNEDFETIGKICLKIEQVIGIKNQSGSNHEFINTVMKDYNFYTQNM